jgi:hypothetical protein
VNYVQKIIFPNPRWRDRKRLVLEALRTEALDVNEATAI